MYKRHTHRSTRGYTLLDMTLLVVFFSLFAAGTISLFNSDYSAAGAPVAVAAASTATSRR